MEIAITVQTENVYQYFLVQEKKNQNQVSNDCTEFRTFSNQEDWTPELRRSSLCFGDFSEVGPVLGVIDEIPLLVLGHLISLSTVSCVLHARFTRSASKLTCFIFVPVVCF